MEKHVKEHVYRRLSAGGHSESEKVKYHSLVSVVLMNLYFKKNAIIYKLKEILLREYVLLEDYTDKQQEVNLSKDDIVEILDIAKPEKWLVRNKYKNPNQVTRMMVIFLFKSY